MTNVPRAKAFAELRRSWVGALHLVDEWLDILNGRQPEGRTGGRALLLATALLAAPAGRPSRHRRRPAKALPFEPAASKCVRNQTSFGIYQRNPLSKTFPHSLTMGDSKWYEALRG